MTEPQFENFVAQAMLLTYEQRWELVEQLQRTLHPPGEELSQEEWWERWRPEILRRTKTSDAGEPGVSYEEALKRITGKHA